jgi:SPP1 family predicted phage head-tail adaptor
MTTLNAGSLRHRVKLQRQLKKVDARGAATEWVDAYSRWASIENLRGSELEIQRKTFSRATTKIKMRRPTDFEFGATWRVCHGKQIYAINYIGSTGVKAEDIELICETINNVV